MSLKQSVLKFLSENGKKGGASKSLKKIEASRRNIAKAHLKKRQLKLDLNQTVEGTDPK